MTTKRVSVKAQDVKIGDRILVATGVGLRIVEVAEIKTNPRYGWLGFVSSTAGGQYLSFHGWYKPDGEIVREENKEG